MAEENEKKDRGSDLGETAGRRAGREVGGKVGQGAGSGAPAEAGIAGSGSAGAAGSAGSGAAGTAGAGGSAAAGGTAAAGGAAAGAGTGAAAGGAVGAAGGPAAPITVPLAAAAGAIIGRYWKKILITVVALVLAIFLFILLPLIVIMMVIFHFAGGGGAGALQPGGGLKPNFCEVGGDPAHCSGELKKILEAAGAAFHTPPVVLAGILSIEGRHVFGYDDPTVLAAAAPGGKDSGGIPHSSGAGSGIASVIGCAVSYAGAVGPMQFTYEEAETLVAAPHPSNTWASQAPYAESAINDGRVVHPCNVRDSIYAASHFTKILSQTPADFTGPWTMEVVFKVGSGYSGVPLDPGGQGCPDPGVPGFNYCQQLWDYVQAYGLGATIDDGTNQIPNGWPLDGAISTIYCEKVYLDGVLFEPCHPGFDIVGFDVYASMSGKVTSSGMSPTCGGVIDIINANSGYQLHLVHLAQSAVDNWKTDDFVDAGKYIGKVYLWALPGCSSGTHLHYEIRKDSLVVDPTPLVPDPSTIIPPKPNHTAWQDGDPVRLGGGNWTAHK